MKLKGCLVAVVLAGSACSTPAVSSAAPLEPAMLSAKPPPYDRDAFGGWRKLNRWCDVRDQILARDLTATSTSRGCNVLSGTLRDPYSGRVVVGSTRVLDVDHVLSLSETWRLGAWRWSRAQREAYANDPDVLVTTTAAQNRGKSDKPLSQWLPTNDPCGFARHVDEVGDRYGLVDRARDGEVARACR